MTEEKKQRYLRVETIQLAENCPPEAEKREKVIWTGDNKHGISLSFSSEIEKLFKRTF